MKKLVSILFFCTFFIELNGQSTFIFKHFDVIQYNILSYRIYYYAKNTNDFNKIRYECLLPKKGWKLNLDFSKVDIKFPNDNFLIYKIRNYNYEYIRNKEDDKIVKNSIGCGYVDGSDRFYIAVSKEKVLFLSGLFFKDPISYYFNLNNDNLKNFYSYLKIKFLYYNLSDIQFVKKNKQNIVFRAYSNSSLREMEISVSINNFDEVSYMFL